VRRELIVNLFPMFFFIFLALFLAIKSVFIIFFRASFEPQFIFELTPFHVFSGMNNMQLLILSTIIVSIGAYLHISLDKKSILYSLIPTSIMLFGSILSIIKREIALPNIIYYLIFGLLILVLVVDYRLSLFVPLKTEKVVKRKSITLILRRKAVPVAQKAGRANKMVKPHFLQNLFKRGKGVNKMEKKHFLFRKKAERVTSEKNKAEVKENKTQIEEVKVDSAEKRKGILDRFKRKEMTPKEEAMEPIVEEIEDRLKPLSDATPENLAAI